jgi:geranyl-CoA carboxylase alpha subunit
MIEGDGSALTVTDAEGARHAIEIVSAEDGVLRYRAEGVMRSVPFHVGDEEIVFEVDGSQYTVRDMTMAPPEAADGAAADGLVRAPITGMVISVEVAEGERVERGQVLATLEAMKMQHMVLAPVAGLVGTLAVATGAQISARDLIVEIVEEGA